jgi:precorrin-2 methylase
VLVEQLAVLFATGRRRSEAARLLDVDQAAILKAEKRLKAVTEHL